jgi:hypothetical protein
MIPVEDPDLTEKNVPIDAKSYIEWFHSEITRHVGALFLKDAWRIIDIEERGETLRSAIPNTYTWDTPQYVLKTLATFEITAIENGPLERMVDGEPVAIHRRKLRCKAELDADGSLKITECDIEAPRRAGY